MIGLKQDEIVIRRCPSCAQPYDTEISTTGYSIQPEKCSRCHNYLPLLVFDTSDKRCSDLSFNENKARYYIR